MSCAEAIDHLNGKVAWGMLFMGVTYFLRAAEQLVEPGAVNSTLDIVSGITMVTSMLLTFWAIWPVAKLKIGNKLINQPEGDSFLTDAMNMSFKNSWIITFMTTTLCLAFQKFMDDWGLPVSFYLIFLFGFMAVTASLSFFYLTKKDDLEDLEE